MDHTKNSLTTLIYLLKIWQEKAGQNCAESTVCGDKDYTASAEEPVDREQGKKEV